MEKICLLLSGGVDSSVVAYELHRQGIHPDCYYIKIGPEDDKEWDCSSEEDLEMATAVARKYGCRLKVVDCHKEYWEQVTRYTMDKVRNGFTPNPDVMCNRLIKFGAFHEKIGKDYDLIATGHYAQTEIIDGKKWLVTSPDPVKDQTDFLAQIYDWQLKKAVFPIGHYLKGEVREIAEREHLVNAKRKDSQGICFLGKINYNDYIRRYLGEKPGEVLEYETGKLIGKHKGLWFHTIGQRHGLGFGGGPWFVVKKDMERNVLYVSKGYDPETAYKDEFLIRDLHILTESPFAPDADGNVPTAVNITFKIRHTPEHHKAVLENLNDGTYLVHSEQKIHGVAPGQFCVIYDEEHHRCYGSGELAPGPQPPKGGVDSDADSDLDFGFDSGFKLR
ncbi:MAG: tRNA 2-thiouridine(34) synthase MnmA [Bacteroidaceae bacterium]|nr:tRNA 2-thiouridine(34) synthase MnmA [Bacteroidaceae bacterium]